jgi:DNA-binding beta-propeller fold protein YncE
VVFDSEYLGIGGSDTAYEASTLTTFYLNPSDPRYLSSKTSGVANADLDLGVSAAGTSVAYARAPDNRIFVTDKTNDRLYVVNSLTGALLSTTNLPSGGGPTAMYFNPVSRNLYVYNSVAGSVSEYNVASATVATTTGIGSATSVGANPQSVMTGDDTDGVIYIANPDTGSFVNFDPSYGTVRALSGHAAGGVVRDKTNKRAFGASYSGNKIIQIK